MRIQKRGSHARTASSHGTATLYLAFINKPTSLSLSHARAPSFLLALSTCPSFCPSISFCLALSLSLSHCLLLFRSILYLSSSSFLSSTTRQLERATRLEEGALFSSGFQPPESINTRFQSLVCFPHFSPSTSPFHLSPLHHSIVTLCLNLFAHIVDVCKYQSKSVIYATEILRK